MSLGALKLIFTLSLSLVIFRVEAQEVCAIQGESDSFMKCLARACPSEERTRSISFPDGRVLWVVGQDHSERNLSMRELLDLEEQKASVPQIREKLAKILRENYIATENAKADINLLRRFVSKDSSPRSLVGVESMQSHLSDLRKDLADLRKFFAEHKELRAEDKRDAETVLLTVFGPQLYLEAREGRYRHATLRGFESKSALEKAQLAERICDENYLKLHEKFQGRPYIAKRLRDARVSFVQLAENYEPKHHDQSVKNHFRQSDWAISPEEKEEVLKWVESELKVLSTRLNRDKGIARQLAKANGNQLHFIGAMHLNALTKSLRDLCLEQNKKMQETSVLPEAAVNIPLLPEVRK